MKFWEINQMVCSANRASKLHLFGDHGMSNSLFSMSRLPERPWRGKDSDCTFPPNLGLRVFRASSAQERPDKETHVWFGD